MTAVFEQLRKLNLTFAMIPENYPYRWNEY